MGDVVKFPRRPVSTALDRMIRNARAEDVARMIERPIADGHNVVDLSPAQQDMWAHLTFNGG